MNNPKRCREDQKMRYPTIPKDFPRDSGQAAIGGYRPKLILRRASGQLISGPTDEELFARYDACEDLAGQLATYIRRKLGANPLQSLLSKVETDVIRKVSLGQWDISSGEIAWIMKRVRELLAEHRSDDRP
ncbi:hypothetical protein WK92_24550 [Burkholderia ubonensis]|uniref:hypothetical protein n=1 Tax=Burkholderia ubonensis TaxID=101571 RepID=UPI00075EC423|nr:hypothetical protein [Burkholderia ubonensis]KVV46728.1 hypothetical protein WK82_15220 [Burkholderia ubonensis]KVW13740.1 hypothetical protein WK92_24550 [Burkholderia ubonensis]